jgi:hypothetical protein
MCVMNRPPGVVTAWSVTYKSAHNREGLGSRLAPPISTGLPTRMQLSKERRKLASPGFTTRSPLRASRARTQPFAWPCARQGSTQVVSVGISPPLGRIPTCRRQSFEPPKTHVTGTCQSNTAAFLRCCTSCRRCRPPCPQPHLWVNHQGPPLGPGGQDGIVDAHAVGRQACQHPFSDLRRRQRPDTSGRLGQGGCLPRACRCGAGRLAHLREGAARGGVDRVAGARCRRSYLDSRGQRAAQRAVAADGDAARLAALHPAPHQVFPAGRHARFRKTQSHSWHTCATVNC